MKIDLTNKADLISFGEVVMDIAVQVKEGLDEKELDYDYANMCFAVIDWAIKFEEGWKALDLGNDDAIEYSSMLSRYVNRKLVEYFEDWGNWNDF